VITAAIGIATVFFCVRVEALPKREAPAPGANAYYAEMLEGFRYVGSLKWLKTMFIACAAFGILASPAAMLTPLQVARSFGSDVWRLTVIELAFSAGMMAGGVLIAVWGGFKNKAHTMILAWLLFGVATVLFGVIPHFGVYVGVMLFCGCSMPVYNTPAATMMQTKIPPQVMGRVFSALMIINGLAMPLGMALFGPLGDLVAIEPLLVITGVLLLAGGLVQGGRRELIEAGR
jgi:DHA3 family macrolide efflux protein-like MFS transporter